MERRVYPCVHDFLGVAFKACADIFSRKRVAFGKCSETMTAVRSCVRVEICTFKSAQTCGFVKRFTWFQFAKRVLFAVFVYKLKNLVCRFNIPVAVNNCGFAVFKVYDVTERIFLGVGILAVLAAVCFNALGIVCCFKSYCFNIIMSTRGNFFGVAFTALFADIYNNSSCFT